MKLKTVRKEEGRVNSLKLAMDVLNLVLKKLEAGMPSEHLEQILRSKLLHDLLDGNVKQVDRDQFRKTLGLIAIGMEPLEICKKS